jgi:hypothetical protein
MIGGVISWMLDLLSLIPLIGIVFTILKIAVAIAFFLVIFIFAIRAGRFAAKGRAVDLPIIGYLRFIK